MFFVPSVRTVQGLRNDGSCNRSGLVADDIEEDNGIHGRKRTILLFVDGGHDFVGDLGNELHADVRPVLFLQESLTIGDRHAAGIKIR